MQQSSSSLRSNRYSTSTQSRRQYLSNQPVHAYPSPSPAPTYLQQQQIESLQQKVDMILIHNNQLIEENLQLKKRIEVLSIREVDARFSFPSDPEQPYLSHQLQVKRHELALVSQQLLQSQEQLAQQTRLMSQMTHTNNNLLQQKLCLDHKLSLLTVEHQAHILKLKQEYENEIYENSLKMEIEHKNELRQKESVFEELMHKRETDWDRQRAQGEENQILADRKMQDQISKVRADVRKDVEEEFKAIFRKMEADADEKCRKVRQQSESYIKTILEQNQNSQQPNQQLKSQIEALQKSLQTRQRLLQSLLQQKPASQTTSYSYYNEAQQLRERIKQLNQTYMQQSELLKQKQAIQYDLGIKQTVKAYENKIDVLTSINIVLENEKNSLRTMFEDEVRSKIKMRHKFEVEVSKLKNYIRKMKVELESYGKEMRLNIEGIRDQANSFSMSILGELGQEKNKKNFYEEEIRKMREVVDLKEREMDILTKQTEDKSAYYDDKIKAMKATIYDLSEQLEGKEERFKSELEGYKDTAKEEFKREKEFWRQQSQDLKKEIIDLRRLSQKLEESLSQSESARKGLQKDLQKAFHDIQSHKSHIDALKLQMDMMGQTQAEQHTQSLRAHYERIIEQLEQDKQLLKETNLGQQEQIGRLIGKYKVLEKSMEKSVAALKKKSQLESRVLELGMDQNLVKNLCEVFRKGEKLQKIEKSEQIGHSQSKENIC